MPWCVLLAEWSAKNVTILEVRSRALLRQKFVHDFVVGRPVACSGPIGPALISRRPANAPAAGHGPAPLRESYRVARVCGAAAGARAITARAVAAAEIH